MLHMMTDLGMIWKLKLVANVAVYLLNGVSCREHIIQLISPSADSQVEFKVLL